MLLPTPSHLSSNRASGIPPERQKGGRDFTPDPNRELEQRLEEANHE